MTGRNTLDDRDVYRALQLTAEVVAELATDKDADEYRMVDASYCGPSIRELSLFAPDHTVAVPGEDFKVSSRADELLRKTRDRPYEGGNALSTARLDLVYVSEARLIVNYFDDSSLIGVPSRVSPLGLIRKVWGRMVKPRAVTPMANLDVTNESHRIFTKLKEAVLELDCDAPAHPLVGEGSKWHKVTWNLGHALGYLAPRHCILIPQSSEGRPSVGRYISEEMRSLLHYPKFAPNHRKVLQPPLM